MGPIIDSAGEWIAGAVCVVNLQFLTSSQHGINVIADFRRDKLRGVCLRL